MMNSNWAILPVLLVSGFLSAQTDTCFNVLDHSITETFVSGDFSLQLSDRGVFRLTKNDSIYYCGSFETYSDTITLHPDGMLRKEICLSESDSDTHADSLNVSCFVHFTESTMGMEVYVYSGQDYAMIINNKVYPVRADDYQTNVLGPINSIDIPIWGTGIVVVPDGLKSKNIQVDIVVDEVDIISYHELFLVRNGDTIYLMEGQEDRGIPDQFKK